jgi:hypothetical protein
MKECSNISYKLHFGVLRSITKIKISHTSYHFENIFFIFYCALCIKNVGLRTCLGYPD